MTQSHRSVDLIRERMSHIRHEFREDVEEMVDSAREFADWKSYVRSYPWICLGAAAAAGYFMVPQRLHIESPDAEEMRKLAKQNRLVVEANPKGTARTTWLNSAAAFLGHLVLRQGMALAGQKLGAMMSEDDQPQQHSAAIADH